VVLTCRALPTLLTTGGAEPALSVHEESQVHLHLLVHVQVQEHSVAVATVRQGEVGLDSKSSYLAAQLLW
jgi:hypothetical protein